MLVLHNNTEGGCCLFWLFPFPWRFFKYSTVKMKPPVFLEREKVGFIHKIRWRPELVAVIACVVNQILGKGSMRTLFVPVMVWLCCWRRPFRNVLTGLLVFFLMGPVCMFLASLAAFQVMNVNPCISTVSVAAAEGRGEIRSWKAKVCFFLPLRYSGCRSWGESRDRSCLLVCLLHHEALPAYNGRCSVERCSRVSSLLVEGGKKSPKLMNFAGSGPCWVLVAALCRAVCCFPSQCAGARGTDCWKGTKKLPEKLLFCWINSTED